MTTDPNEALRVLRELMPLIRNDEDGNRDDDGAFEPYSEDIAANAFDVLDTWLRNGGALPTDWNRTP